MSPSSKSSVFTKVFLSSPKPASVFKFLRFEDRFRKTLFSWLISVDCRLKEERKLRFQISLWLCRRNSNWPWNCMQTVSLLCTKKTICVEKKKTLGDNKREVNSNIFKLINYSSSLTKETIFVMVFDLDYHIDFYDFICTFNLACVAWLFIGLSPLRKQWSREQTGRELKPHS